MAQLSVPISDIEDGTQSGTITSIGTSTFWEALAEDDLETYVNSHLGPVLELGFTPGTTFEVALQPIIDAGVDIGLTLRYIARLNPGLAVAHREVLVMLGAFRGDDRVLIFGNINVWDDITSEFALYTFPLPVDIVQYIRELGAWNDLYIRVDVGSMNTEVGDVNADFDFAFIQLEAPSAGPGLGIIIISDAGLFFDGAGLNIIEITGDAGLKFDCTSIIALDPTVIIDTGADVGGLEFDFTAAAIVDNQIILDGEGGLIFGALAHQFVLSKDVSGLYTFIPDRHYDEIMSRNVASNEKQDVKIPDPQGKTGFFGG